MDIRRVVGKNVRRYRIEAKLSLNELAAGMGVEQGYVSRSGKRWQKSHYRRHLARGGSVGCRPCRLGLDSIQAIKTTYEADEGYKDTFGDMSLGKPKLFHFWFQEVAGRVRPSS
jgi:transcriptional regulator with XRE-family HTH domain